MPGKVYCGKRVPHSAGPALVWVQGKLLSPARSQTLRVHSPEGFQWGYCGSGPAQLALALLLDALARTRASVHWYQTFKRQVVAKFADEWVLTQEEILTWYSSARRDLAQDTEEQNDEQQAEAGAGRTSRNQPTDHRESTG